jgi:hypothetical protein
VPVGHLQIVGGVALIEMRELLSAESASSPVTNPSIELVSSNELGS